MCMSILTTHHVPINKTIPMISGYNLGKCKPIFKILSPTDSQEKIVLQSLSDDQKSKGLSFKGTLCTCTMCLKNKTLDYWS